MGGGGVNRETGGPDVECLWLVIGLYELLGNPTT
jgi:hypothetical protein